jgi:hypothetical protein
MTSIFGKSKPRGIVGCYTWRATGITIYLKNDGRLEHAQQMAATSFREQLNFTIEQRTKLH